MYIDLASVCLTTQQYSISQFEIHVQQLKVEHSGGPLDNQTWRTEWKTAPLAKV